MPRNHFLGVAFGFVPALAAWLLLNIDTTLRVVGSSLAAAAPKFSPADIALPGLFALNQGFILTAMLFAAMLVYATERQWLRVAAWALAGALAAWFGIIHAWTLGPLGLEVKLGWGAAPGFAVAYLGVAGVALALRALAQPPAEPRGGRRFFDKRAARFERETREGGPSDGKPQGPGGGRRRRWRGGQPKR